MQGKKALKQHGVAVAKNLEMATTIASNLLGGELITIQTGPVGKIVSKILVAQDVYYRGPLASKGILFINFIR